MKKSEIILAVKNRIDELDVDEQIDAVLNSAFNYAYCYELGKLDKRITTEKFTAINSIIELPSNILDIEYITPELLSTERRIGNSIVTFRDVEFTIIYSTVRDIPRDTEELDIDYPLQYLLELYCCIAYYSHRKRDNVVNMYTNEYNNKKLEYLEGKEEYVEEQTKDVYSTDLQED